MVAVSTSSVPSVNFPQIPIKWYGYVFNTEKQCEKQRQKYKDRT